MANRYGHISLDDNQHAFVTQLGQRLVFDAANEYLARYSQEIVQMNSLFIQEQTTIYKERYMSAGGGRLMKRSGSAPSPTVKAGGSWDVAYPIYEWGAQISYTRRSAAKLTVAELQRHMNTVVLQANDAMRYEILKSIFNSTAATFVDEDYGSLTIERLANGDSVTYPPVLGSATEATENHYLESGYAATAISDTNNPYVTVVEDLVQHWGRVTGGTNVITFINAAEAPETMDLTDFVEVPDQYIRSGADADIPQGLPAAPGQIIGRMTGLGATWVSVWDWMPANYMFSLYLDAPAPLKMRVPEFSGLPSSLTLVAEHDEYPFHNAHYEINFGLGVANRLNGVVMELGTGGSYTVPTDYQ